MNEDLDIKLTNLIENIDNLLTEYCNSDSTDILNSIYGNLSNQSILKKWLQSLNITDLPPSTANDILGNISTDTNSSLVSIPFSPSIVAISGFDSIQKDILQQNIDNDDILRDVSSSDVNKELKLMEESELTCSEDINKPQHEGTNNYHHNSDIIINNNNKILDNNIKNNIDNQSQEQAIISNNNVSITMPAVSHDNIKLEHIDNSRNKRKQSGRRLSDARQKKKKEKNLNNQVDDEWNAMYLQLILYHSSHNTYEVPLEYNVEDDQGNILSLGIWYCDQKISYEEYKHDEYTKHWYDMIKDIMENNPQSCNNTLDDHHTSSNHIVNNIIQVKSEIITDQSNNIIINSNNNNENINFNKRIHLNELDNPNSYIVNNNIQIKSEHTLNIINNNTTNTTDKYDNNSSNNNENNKTTTNSTDTFIDNNSNNYNNHSDNNDTTNNTNIYDNNNENNPSNQIPSYIAFLKTLEPYNSEVKLKLGYIKEIITISKDLIVYELDPLDSATPYTTLYSINSSKEVKVNTRSVLLYDIMFEIDTSNNSINNNSISNNSTLILNHNCLKLTEHAIDIIKKCIKKYDPMMIF